jgi:dimethylargininase
MLIAFTRAVPPSINGCELTHLVRARIDFELASAQHRAYERAVAALGCPVQRLPSLPELPDSVFVEDTAVVLPEIAILARPGAASRRPEVPSVAEALRPHRSLVGIEPPGTLDGGDVLQLGPRIFVGSSGRTNERGIRQLRDLVSGFGYEVQAVPLTGCLHLKTAVSAVAEGVVLLNPEWVDPGVFAGFRRIEVHPAEPFAANALRVGEVVLLSTAHSRTKQRLVQSGLRVRGIEAGELAKAEAGLTCCSVLVPV